MSRTWFAVASSLTFEFLKPEAAPIWRNRLDTMACDVPEGGEDPAVPLAYENPDSKLQPRNSNYPNPVGC